MISLHFQITFGVFLMLLGVILPFLMMVNVFESTFFLNFFSYGTSVAGLALGIIGFMVGSRGKRQ